MKTLAFFFALIAPVFARIGETIADCEARYGKGTLSSNGATKTYSKGGFEIECWFREGKVVSLLIYHTDKEDGRPKTISKTELDTLLEANAGSSKWKTSLPVNLSRQPWTTEDDSRHAIYELFEHKIMIITTDEVARQTKARNAMEKAQLDGF